jgi:hypothetical protein
MPMSLPCAAWPLRVYEAAATRGSVKICSRLLAVSVIVVGLMAVGSGPRCASIKLDRGIEPQGFIRVSLECLEVLS